MGVLGWVIAIIGGFLGVCIIVIVLSSCVVAGRADDEYERLYREQRGRM